MAVRLINLHQRALRIDLRGGDVLMLPAGQRSAALREELLYDNCHLPDWERAGWISRVPARMSEVQAVNPPAPVRKARKGSPPEEETKAQHPLRMP
jgi:hypothetical protein